MDRFPGGKYDSYDDDEEGDQPQKESSKLRPPIPLSEILGRSNAGSGNFLSNLGISKSAEKSATENEDDDDDEEEDEKGLFRSFAKSSKAPRPARLGGLGLGSLGASRVRREQAPVENDASPDVAEITSETSLSDGSAEAEQLREGPQKAFDNTPQEAAISNEVVVQDVASEGAPESQMNEAVEAQSVAEAPEADSDDDEDQQVSATSRTRSTSSQTSATSGANSSISGNVNVPPPSPSLNPNIITPPPPTPRPNPNLYPPTPTPSPNVLSPNTGDTTVIERTSYKGAVGAFVAAELSSRYRDRKIKREFREADKKLGKKIEKLANKQLSQAEAQASLSQHQKTEIYTLDRKQKDSEKSPAAAAQLTEIQRKAEIINNFDIDQRAEARAEVHSTMPSIETLVKAENTYENLIEERNYQEVKQENVAIVNRFEALDNENQRSNNPSPDIAMPPPIGYVGSQAQDLPAQTTQSIVPKPVDTPMPARVEPPAKGQYTQSITFGVLAAVIVLVVVIMAYALAR